MRKSTPFVAVRALLVSAGVAVLTLLLGTTVDMAAGSSATLVVRGLEEPPEYLSLELRHGGLSGYPYVVASEADGVEVAAAQLRDRLRDFNETLRETRELLRMPNEPSLPAHETAAAMRGQGRVRGL